MHHHDVRFLYAFFTQIFITFLNEQSFEAAE